MLMQYDLNFSFHDCFAKEGKISIRKEMVIIWKKQLFYTIYFRFTQ